MNHERSEREALVLELLALNTDGMRGREIGQMLGLTRASMWVVMPKLIDAGKVLMIGTKMANGLIGGSHVRYCLPANKALAEIASGMKNRDYINRERRRQKRCSKNDPAYGDEEFEAIPDAPMIQRRVLASECEPLRPRGPASVWQLGIA